MPISSNVLGPLPDPCRILGGAGSTGVCCRSLADNGFLSGLLARGSFMLGMPGMLMLGINPPSILLPEEPEEDVIMVDERECDMMESTGEDDREVLCEWPERADVGRPGLGEDATRSLTGDMLLDGGCCWLSNSWPRLGGEEGTILPANFFSLCDISTADRLLTLPDVEGDDGRFLVGEMDRSK